MTTSYHPKQNQLIVTVNDPTLLKSIKKAISLMRGVEKVKYPARRKKTGIEEALDEVKEGRVSHWNSVDEMFDELSK